MVDLRETLEGPGFTVELMPGTRILRMTRNAHPFDNVQSMIGALDEFEAQIRVVDRSRFGLLIDTRKVTARHDPEFERAFRHLRDHLVAGFARVGVLVSSPEGLAQATAHSAESGPHVRAFDDEAKAIWWVLEAVGSARPAAMP